MNAATLQAITSRGPKPIRLDMNLIHHWFWKFVPVDPLIFSAPNHDGSTVQIARQVYHRLIGRMVAENAHGMQLGILVVAWLATVFITPIPFRGGGATGTLLGLAAFGALLFFGVPVLMRIACPASATEQAEAIVRRTFLSDLPANTPPDLRDELQHGWLTADGRPLSAELSAEDGRTLEATRRSVWWIVTALAVGWAVASLFVSSQGAAAAGGGQEDFPFPFPGGAGGPGGSLIPGLGLLGLLGSFLVFMILIAKLVFDKRPLVSRAMELAAAEAVEGTAFVAAGGQSWAGIAGAARQRQIAEAAADTSPTVELGETTGVFAGRGDVFGPNAGLPFRLSLRDLQMHMLVLGGTGSGKTSGILRPLARQVSAQDKVGLVIMDGKGSLPAELADLPGMQVIDPARPGTDVSLVTGVEPSVLVDTIREILAPSGGSEDQFWVNSAAGALRRGAVIAQAAGGAWWSLFHSAQIVSLKADRDRVIDALLPKTEHDPLLREACAYFRGEWDEQMDSRTQGNVLAVIRSWLSTITATPELLRWAKTPAGADTVDLSSPLTGGRVGFMIPDYRYGTAGAVVTALLKARLYNRLKARADRDWSQTSETPVVFVIDEAQEVATSQDAQMLAIGRSLGLAMVAATQGLEGVKVKLGEATSEKWLAIFGTVVALSGRSLATDTFVAGRAGEAWALAQTDVPGLTVRANMSISAISGPIAAARTQPDMWQGQVYALPSRIATAVGSLLKVRFRAGDLAAPNSDPARLMLGPRPLVVPGEIASLTAVPDTAVVLATRGRVPRRDIVRLRPEYVKRAGAAVETRVAVQAPAAAPRFVAAPAAAVATAARPVAAQGPAAAVAASAAPVAAATAGSRGYEAVATISAVTTESDPPRCPSCRAEILEPGSTFCGSCGARLT